MDDELILLTSYFNLADGRLQNSADTFRVDSEIPSATAPEGQAALYIVTESTAGSMGRRARQLAADTVAWTYASQGDQPPAARLRSALRAAHDAIRQEFDGHVAVGMSIMVVEGETVYLGQVAPGQVYVLHDESLSGITAAATGSSPLAEGLGSAAGPNIHVYKDTVQVGDILALTSSWFHQSADSGDLRDCFAAGGPEDISSSLLDLSRKQDARSVTAIVVGAVSAAELDMDDLHGTPGFMEQIDSAVQALAAAGRFALAELRAAPPEHVPVRTDVADEPAATSVGLAEPEVETVEHERAHPPSEETGHDWVAPPEEWAYDGEAGAAEQGYEPADVFEWEPTVPEQLTEEVPIVPSEPPADEWQSQVEERETPAEEPEPEPETPERETRRPRDTVSAEADEYPETELDRVNSRIQSSPELGDVIPPVQAFPDTSTEPERIYATSKDIEAANRRPRRFGGIARPARSNSIPVIRPGLDGVDFARPVSRGAPSGVIWGTAAVLAVLAAVAIYLFVHQPHAAVADPYPNLARERIHQAQVAKNPAAQNHYLAKARLDIANARRAGAPAATVAALQRQWQSVSDAIHHITRINNPIVLTDFHGFPNARPTQVATGPGLVFVLDKGRNSVFSITPASTSGPTEIVRAGEIDNNITIGAPVQVASDGKIALVLDNHNNLVRDDQGTKTATGLTAAEPTERIVAMASSDPDVYLLDQANSQVWRYPDAVAGYGPSPAAYWDTNVPKLGNGVSLTFGQMELYVLRSDGTILKYDFSANPQPFNTPKGLSLAGATSISTDPGLNYIWAADPRHGRVLQFGLNGKLVRTYMSGSTKMNLRKMTSMAVGPAGNTVYLLAGSKLFMFDTTH
ncbi:MAG TPA: hypothetical protein VFA78_01060 [Chloroflexota bacterium]|nr:hypothetical protein [Chloroflexota bacterium]